MQKMLISSSYVARRACCTISTRRTLHLHRSMGTSKVPIQLSRGGIGVRTAGHEIRSAGTIGHRYRFFSADCSPPPPGPPAVITSPAEYLQSVGYTDAELVAGMVAPFQPASDAAVIQSLKNMRERYIHACVCVCVPVFMCMHLHLLYF